MRKRVYLIPLRGDLVDRGRCNIAMLTGIWQDILVSGGIHTGRGGDYDMV